MTYYQQTTTNLVNDVLELAVEDEVGIFDFGQRTVDQRFVQVEDERELGRAPRFQRQRWLKNISLTNALFKDKCLPSQAI